MWCENLQVKSRLLLGCAEVGEAGEVVKAQSALLVGEDPGSKTDIPRRPILSMVRSAQHELAKWLGELL